MADQFVPTAWDVALHPEGVDRNLVETLGMTEEEASPSTRRAWIEMAFLYQMVRFGL